MKARNNFSNIGMIVIHPVLTCNYDKCRKILFNILINIEITNDCQSLKIRYIVEFYPNWMEIPPIVFFRFFHSFLYFEIHMACKIKKL